MTGGRVNKAARDSLDTLTAPEPGEQVPSQDDHPVEPTDTETVLREAMQAGAGARADPHACEDCGGDPCCRHRCRVGTVVYRDADNTHEFRIEIEYHGTRTSRPRTIALCAQLSTF